MPIDTRNSAAPRCRGVVIAALAVAIAVGGCLSQSEPSPTSPAVTASPSAATPPPADGTPSPLPAESRPPAPGATETDWGTIWDVLPPGFPIYPGSSPTETGGGAASAVFDAPADVPTVTTWLQAALERAGFSTLSLSGPAEDGSMEIESAGPAVRCLARTTVTPLGGSTIVTVLYGVSCPQS